MNRVKSTGLAVVVALAVLSSGCGGAEAPTVDEVVEHQTKAEAEGTPCEYTWISSDIQHRLNHYRVCTPKGEKQAKALQDALDDCFSLCDETYEFGSEGGVACTQQCKGE